MLSIRMRRTGSKKRPFFRVVVSEARSKKEGQFIEVLGFYNPRTKPAVVEINKERITYWISKGARPSDSVRTLLARHLTRDRAIVQTRDAKGLIETVARALADQPDAVSVKESERRGGTVFELQVASGDLGRVIGRQGRTAAALRTLLSSVAEDDDRRVSLDIRDQTGRS
jgi:small subunit ribosomal protein S16